MAHHKNKGRKKEERVEGGWPAAAAERSLHLLAQQKAEYDPADVSHYHAYLCSVCGRRVEEDEVKGWNVALYPAEIQAWAITGLACSKACVLALVDEIEDD